MISKARHEELQEKIAGTASAIEEAYLQAQKKAAEAEGLRAQGRQLEEQAATRGADAALLENDIAHNSENIARIAREIEEARETGDRLGQEIAEKARGAKEQEERVKELREKLAACEKAAFAFRRQDEDVTCRMG